MIQSDPCVRTRLFSIKRFAFLSLRNVFERVEDALRVVFLSKRDTHNVL